MTLKLFISFVLLIDGNRYSEIVDPASAVNSRFSVLQFTFQNSPRKMDTRNFSRLRKMACNQQRENVSFKTSRASFSPIENEIRELESREFNAIKKQIH